MPYPPNQECTSIPNPKGHHPHDPQSKVRPIGRWAAADRSREGHLPLAPHLLSEHETMSDYRAELDRRIAQFKHYLELMQQRRRGTGGEDCFIIFDDREDPDGPAADHLDESKALVREDALAGVVWGDGAGSASLDETVVVDLPDEGWRGGDSQLRFMQFRFNESSFDLDIPNTTLHRAEADIILRRRSGFFYAVERLELEKTPLNRQLTKRFSPLRKMYVNGDEESAAQDMAFIWFGVWKFPVDWTFFVTASAFRGQSFENARPLPPTPEGTST